MHRCLVLSGILVLAGASGVSAQKGWERGAHDTLAELGDFLAAQGYRPTHEIQLGDLNNATAEDFWVQLNSGFQYAVLGVCDSGCGDIDLELFDRGGNSVDADYQWDDAPLVRVVPDSASRYRVRVRLSECEIDPCAYAVGVFGRSADAGNAWERQVTRQIDEVTFQVQADGYTETHEPRLGRLSAGATREFFIRLRRGTTYSVVGVCDEDCSELHLAIWDPDGKELDFDPISENYPVLAVRPATTGRYRVVVTMAACAAEPCYYGVGVYGLLPASTFQPSAVSRQPAADSGQQYSREP